MNEPKINKNADKISEIKSFLYTMVFMGLFGVAILGADFIAAREAGILGALIGMIFFPITVFVAPIYAIIKHGDWWPILYVYGSLALSLLLIFKAPKSIE